MEHKLYLIRHGKTQGNLRGEYGGISDQPLCGLGMSEIEKYRKAEKYPQVHHVYLSPLLRCRQSTRKIYPDVPFTIVPELAECNFGQFEGKTHEELKGWNAYQKWIELQGRGIIPGGEDPAVFKQRCGKGFEKVVREIIKKKIASSALIIHGGTIMAVLEAYSPCQSDFFHWQIKNGEGFKLTIHPENWEKIKRITSLDKL